MAGIGIGIGIGLGGGGGGAAGLAVDKTTYLASVAAGALIATLVDPYGSGSTFSVVGSGPSTLALASGGRIVAGAGAQVEGQASTIVVRAAKGQRAVEEPLAFTALAAAPAPAPTPAPGAFALSQLPPGSLLFDFMPGQGVTQAGGAVSAWADRVAGVTLSQATAAAQPGFAADGWAAGVPAIVSDGVDDILTGPNPAFETGWIIDVMERGSANGGSTPTSREFYELGRAGDGYKLSVRGQRPGVDAGQTKVDVAAPGSGTTYVTIPGGLAVGERGILTAEMRSGAAASGARNGSVMSDPITSGDAVTVATMSLFGSVAAATRRQGMKLARKLAVSYAILPGGRELQYNRLLIEAHLAWSYGLQAKLPAASPWAGRAPVATDFKAYDHSHSHFGNSLCAGAAGVFVTANGLVAKGVPSFNGGVGGNTTTQIRDRFMAGFDLGTNATSGASTAVQRRRTVYIGEFFANGPSSNGTGDEAQMRGELAEMVAAVETAQGVGAGQARLFVWQSWIRWTHSTGSAGRATSDARNAYLQATYPAYYLPISDALVAMGAPGGKYPDAANHGAGIPPAALQGTTSTTSNGVTTVVPDTLHPNALGYQEMAMIAYAAAVAKGWAV